jgi:hypothetical protein
LGEQVAASQYTVPRLTQHIFDIAKIPYLTPNFHNNIETTFYLQIFNKEFTGKTHY